MQHLTFDHNRTQRIGLPEAVFCEGKPLESLIELVENFSMQDANPLLFTRLFPEIFEQFPKEIQEKLTYHTLSKTAYTKKLKTKQKGTVAIVSAGTSDASVVWEAAKTLEFHGINFQTFEDCGVAGLWRLTSKIPEINNCDIVIAIAGLDAALASVLGGLTPLPIIAVPTSIGYGIAQKGKAALASMLASCAQGLTVTNIDNGYGAACAAIRILNMKDRKAEDRKAVPSATKGTESLWKPQ